MSTTRLRRRAISIPGLLGVTIVVVVFAPLILAVATLVDVARRRRWPTVRLTGFVMNLLAIENLGLVRTAHAWIIAGMGTRLDSQRSRTRHQRLEYWYIHEIYRAAERFLDLRLEVEPGSGLAGGAIVIGRHTSYGDAALPALLAADSDTPIRLRYVLTQGLQWGPCFDLVGNRLPNHFVDRGAADLDALAQLAASAADDTIITIFPEGGFHSPARHRRSVERLRSSAPHLVQQAEELRHLLPPRPRGLLTLMNAAPDADVVVLGHVGFEAFNSIRAIAASVPFTDPVLIRTWRFERGEIPRDDDERIAWLYERWAELDDWIDQYQ